MFNAGNVGIVGLLLLSSSVVGLIEVRLAPSSMQRCSDVAYRWTPHVDAKLFGTKCLVSRLDLS